MGNCSFVASTFFRLTSWQPFLRLSITSFTLGRLHSEICVARRFSDITALDLVTTFRNLYMPHFSTSLTRTLFNFKPCLRNALRPTCWRKLSTAIHRRLRACHPPCPVINLIASYHNRLHMVGKLRLFGHRHHHTQLRNHGDVSLRRTQATSLARSSLVALHPLH